MIERQELYCHSCGMYVQFNLDTELNGEHVLRCPVCGHEHCRYVQDGRISDQRWDSRNRLTYYVRGATTTATSTSSNNIYTFYSWGTGSS